MGRRGYRHAASRRRTPTSISTRARRVKEFPDYYIADATLENGRKITDANPQQKDFLWTQGRPADRLHQHASGEKLQGALYLPANYEPGEEVPDNR